LQATNGHGRGPSTHSPRVRGRSADCSSRCADSRASCRSSRVARATRMLRERVCRSASCSPERGARRSTASAPSFAAAARLRWPVSTARRLHHLAADGNTLRAPRRWMTWTYTLVGASPKFSRASARLKPRTRRGASSGQAEGARSHERRRTFRPRPSPRARAPRSAADSRRTPCLRHTPHPRRRRSLPRSGHILESFGHKLDGSGKRASWQLRGKHPSLLKVIVNITPPAGHRPAAWWSRTRVIPSGYGRALGGQC
jgi:hypothetical protein